MMTGIGMACAIQVMVVWFPSVVMIMSGLSRILGRTTEREGKEGGKENKKREQRREEKREERE